MRRRSPLRDHPFWEEAQVLRALLREDRAINASGSGRVIIAGLPDLAVPRLRAEAAHLERMARADINYPEV